MGIFKFIIKHGPGSVGHNAKTLAKMYVRLQKAYPNLSKRELFKELLKWRMGPLYGALIGKKLTEDEMNKMIENAGGKLSKLIFELSHWERPIINNLADDDIDKYGNVLEVIEEMVQKYAPVGDKTNSKYEINWDVAKKYGISESEVSGELNFEKLGMPKTVKEAVERIISTFPQEELQKLAAMSEDDLIDCHFGLGVWIRNNFGLWKENEFLLKDAGSDIPDTASMNIVKAVWQKLREKNLDKNYSQGNNFPQEILYLVVENAKNYIPTIEKAANTKFSRVQSIQLLRELIIANLFLSTKILEDFGIDYSVPKLAHELYYSLFDEKPDFRNQQIEHLMKRYAECESFLKERGATHLRDKTFMSAFASAVIPHLGEAVGKTNDHELLTMFMLPFTGNMKSLTNDVLEIINRFYQMRSKKRE